MTGLVVLVVPLAVGFTLAVIESHRAKRRQLRAVLGEVRLAKQSGSAQARLQYPWVDLSRCIGCGTCVSACPEHGVLDLVHGQAAVVHGSRCVGHGRCAEQCPVEGIVLTLGDLQDRNDIPALSDLEAVDQNGLFLAGEVTGYALIRTAVQHGKRVAAEVAARLVSGPAPASSDQKMLDLCIIGAGPAGLSCSLEAKRLGLDFVTLEQQSLGGTVAKYPRRKLVMTQPLQLPLGPALKSKTYQKEELIDLWQRLSLEHQLPIQQQVTVQAVEKLEDGSFEVRTGKQTLRARFVCMALGRRGTPRKLGVPGEEQQKVVYSLIDAAAYQGRRMLVVGGGDSAVEAALALARQPRNEVHISYRREQFFRLKARNELEAMQAVKDGRIQAHFATRVVAIERDHVKLTSIDDEDATEFHIDNDDVLVMAGGLPPFPFLQASGVSFDPALHPEQAALAEQGTGLRWALYLTMVASLLTIAFYWLHLDYYHAPLEQRVDMPEHDWLRSSRGAGLVFGLAAAACMIANLIYLLRRAHWFPLSIGSLKLWMTSHVGTGLLAFLAAWVHSTFSPESTVAGHALLGLGALVVTGAIGRYFYSYVPRATNGRELALEEAMGEMHQNSQQWTRLHREFGESARQRITELLETTRWRRGFWGSLLGLIGSRRRLRAALSDLRLEARQAGVDRVATASVLQLARKVYRSSLTTSHFDDLNRLLSSWRYFHRWLAFLVVLLVIVHVVTAMRFVAWEGLL
jgi:dihydropyrimidine dehydrogenase (NAD+) subunit PreT